jgi:sugar phosphate isomerase/epimerase
VSWAVGLSTGIGYRHPIEHVLPAIAEAGFRLIEVSTAPGHLPAGAAQLPGLRRLLAAHGLGVHSLHAPFGHDVNLTSPDAGQRAHAVERLTEAADVLQALGGGLYVIHPGGEDQRWVWEREERLRLSVEGLTRVWGLCRERGLELVVETPLPHLLGGRLDDFTWILDRLPVEGTGVCVDTSHCALGGHLFDAVRRLASRVVHIQASDNQGVTDDHLPPGEGVIDWARFADALRQAEYGGVVMLEVAGDGGAAAQVRRAADAARAFRPCRAGPVP